MTYKTRIKFAEKEWLVIDNIEYKNEKYYYIIEDIAEQLENIDNLEEYKGSYKMEFIYKLENGNYKNVVDQNLIQQLLAVVGQRMILNKKDLE
jgi:hypothetical protein